jgi:hypothetical protein
MHDTKAARDPHDARKAEEGPPNRKPDAMHDECGARRVVALPLARPQPLSPQLAPRLEPTTPRRTGCQDAKHTRGVHTRDVGASTERVDVRRAATRTMSPHDHAAHS